MAAVSAKTWPDLKACWDEYGFNTKWEDIAGALFRSDGCYVVLLVPINDGRYELIDIAKGGEWDVQNDGSDAITMEQWEHLKIVPGCDGYEYPEENELAILLHHDRRADAKYAAAFDAYEEGFRDAGNYDRKSVMLNWVASEAFKQVEPKKKGKKK